jgi:hypothetical protein
VEYYQPGERRIHKVRERDLWLLIQAARALLDLDAHHQILAGPMEPSVRLHLTRSVETCETMISWRERYG